jgi:hypothetical protein
MKEFITFLPSRSMIRNKKIAVLFSQNPEKIEYWKSVIATTIKPAMTSLWSRRKRDQVTSNCQSCYMQIINYAVKLPHYWSLFHPQETQSVLIPKQSAG